MKLYEATTDQYYGCGIGSDSKRWNSMDWKGENVAGLVVMKVREELFHESLPLNGLDEYTLVQIASQHVDEDMDLEISGHDLSPLETTVIHRDNSYHNFSSGSSPTDKLSYTDALKSRRPVSVSAKTSTPDHGNGRGNVRGHKPSE